MKPEKVEKLIKRINVTPYVEMDRRILTDALQAQEKTKKLKLSDTQPHIWKVVVKNKSVSLAAAVVLIALCWFAISDKEQPVRRKIAKSAIAAKQQKTPAELTTVASLSLAYRQGGMKKVEEMCDKAVIMAGPRPATISAQELFK